MRVETFHCDGCGRALHSEDQSRERCFELSTPFSTREFDICRECWKKMTEAVHNGRRGAFDEPNLEGRKG